MRITYRTLAGLIDKMSYDQKNCFVTIEDLGTGECLTAELRICGPLHDSLENDQPTLVMHIDKTDHTYTVARMDNVDEIWGMIGFNGENL